MSYFEDPEQLGFEIAAFVAEGLRLGQPALVVTCPRHQALITAELDALGVNVPGAIAAGDLLCVDAEETLDAIMNGDLPDANRYHQSVGDVVTQLLNGRPGPVRIFGDMVDLLWQRGQYDAAIKIEMLSNQLAVLHPITVICGYSMGHFLKKTHKLQQVQTLHGRMHQARAVAADRVRKVPAR